jgi:hypothetical protein
MSAMNLWFVDDSRQRSPSRDRMGPLCSAGALFVPEARLKSLESSLEQLCASVGFPTRQEFKWSPGRELWMHDNLRLDARTDFFLEAVRRARDHGVIGILACVDVNHRPVTNASTHELDVVRLLLERIHQHTPRLDQALIIADTPSGGSIRTNDSFISDCLDTLRSGTNIFASLDRICMVLTCSSHLNRCLQFADVFTSCLTAFIAGEDRWSPPVATALRALLRTEMGRVGGCGIKLHPDYVYSNLYHWLFGDEHLVRFNMGTPYPLLGRPYGKTPDVFRD